MRGAIAAGHELTARAGASALAAGGNAVDAAVAAGVMSWAAEPALTGPCGGGFLLIAPHRGTATLLDAFTAIPGRNLPPERKLTEIESVDVPFDARTTQVFHIGPATCAVPGAVAGLHAAHRRFGRLPWRDLVLPAAAAAQEGVPTNPGQQRVFEAIRVILTHTPETRELFAPGGRFVEVGTPVRQVALAGSIEHLAEAPDDLYRGDLARAMVDYQAVTGGRLTMEDLAAYRPVWRRPLRVAVGSHQLATNPPPSSGGVLIAHMLSVLAAVGGDRESGSAGELLVLAETMRAAARLRDRSFARLLHRGGLAAHVLGPESRLHSVAAVMAALRGVRRGAPLVHSDRGTTHISVVDGEGTAVAFTASNGSHSGVIVPGTGLHLNNMMGEEDLAVGRHLAPGVRLTSMQAPTMVTRNGRLELVVGSSGSNRLRSAITQVVWNVIEHRMDVDSAVRHPRVHVEGDRLDCEGGFDPAELERLEGWGELLNRFDGLNLYFGGANAVVVGADGALSAAGDPRRDCAGLVL